MTEMAKPLSLFLFSLLVFSLLSLSSSENPKLSSAHEELKSKGFPIGLLPSNVLTYSFNRTSGDFSLYLSDTCKLTLPPDNYLATYSKTIKGNIIEGKIAELDGIRVRAFFKWWSITGIKSSGQDLVFEVGMVTAKYPSKNFEEAPACEGRRASS